MSWFFVVENNTHFFTSNYLRVISPLYKNQCRLNSIPNHLFLTRHHPCVLSFFSFISICCECTLKTRNDVYTQRGKNVCFQRNCSEFHVVIECLQQVLEQLQVLKMIQSRTKTAVYIFCLMLVALHCIIYIHINSYLLCEYVVWSRLCISVSKQQQQYFRKRIYYSCESTS